MKFVGGLLKKHKYLKTKMQFSVPQFTDVEDKLIGPLTLKQFVVLLVAGGICLMFWSLPIPKIIAIFIDLPFAIAGIALAFGNYNSRPMLSYILPFVTYIISPRDMIFQREGNQTSVLAQPEKPKVQETAISTEELEPTDSRLKKLAYMLDQKTSEEKELINKTISRNIKING